MPRDGQTEWAFLVKAAAELDINIESATFLQQDATLEGILQHAR